MNAVTPVPGGPDSPRKADATARLPGATQTATDHAPARYATTRDWRAACAAARRGGAQAAPGSADGRDATPCARATAPGKRTRAAAERYQRFLSERAAGVYAVTQLSHRVQRSLPRASTSSRATLRTAWVAVHRRAADIALRQARRSVRRLGLTHVADTRGFLRAHVGWYWSFCDLSAWLLREPSVSLRAVASIPQREEAA